MEKSKTLESLDLKPLKMIIKDVEDLQIMAAHLQDALIPMMSLSYDPESKTFRALANRFCWEHGEVIHEGEPLYHRTHTGLEVHQATKVLQKGFDPDSHQKSYNLLTVHDSQDGAIHLVFSGGAELRIEIDDIHLHVGDLEQPWPTRKKPKHVHEHFADRK